MYSGYNKGDFFRSSQIRDLDHIERKWLCGADDWAYLYNDMSLLWSSVESSCGDTRYYIGIAIRSELHNTDGRKS